MSTAPRLTIDLNALVNNWQFLKEKSGKAECSAVIKANAYGLGIEPVATALTGAGCKTFFVAMAEEGARVRAVAPDADIYVLNGIFADTLEVIAENNLSPVLGNVDQVSLWATSGMGKPSALHVDTGMNRLGLDVEEALQLAENTSMLKRLNALIIMSHLACADDPDHEHNTLQHENFKQVIGKYPELKASFSNSAATLTNTGFHYDLTRPGVALYGAEAVNDIANPVQPVVTAQSRILQIRHAKAGEKVGYGAEAILDRPTKIATISGGYADGFHRALSGAGVPLRGAKPTGGNVWLEGHLAPILGRVSMDLITVDVTDVPDQILQEAKWVELFGKNIAVDDAARACGTIGYELLTSLGGRYQRSFIG